MLGLKKNSHFISIAPGRRHWLLLIVRKTSDEKLANNFIALCSKLDPSKDMASDRKEHQEEKDVMTSLWKKMYN
jgi:hypothetical protein